MHNINAFFKLRAKEMKISNKDIAEQYSLSNPFVSRVFNNQVEIKDDRNLLKFCKCFKLDKDKLFLIDKKFEEKVRKYLHTVYFIESNRIDCFNEIMEYKVKYRNTPYYIDIILIEFIHKVVYNQFDGRYQMLRDKFYFIEKSLISEEQKLFLTYDFKSMQYQNKFDEAEIIFEKANEIQCDDVNVNMMLAYFGFSFKWKNNPLSKNIENYYECMKYCEKTNNINRLFNIEIKYAMFLGNHGDIEGELNHELYLLEMLNEKNIQRNRANLINNIAYSYSLLKQYDKAVIYYLENFKTHQDNDTCFHLAWCYYNLKEIKKARKYLEVGLNGSNRGDYHYLFLEWLQAMINKKYSSKAYELLIQIKTEYKESMPNENYHFVLMELYNYYHYHHQEQELFEIGQELLNKNVISVTDIREEDFG